MVRIETYSLGELAANCYIVHFDDSCVVIDPGDSAEFIAQKIEESKHELVAMIATHGHFDHVMAVGELQLSYNVPFFVHEKDMFLIHRIAQTAQHFLSYKPVVIPPKNIHDFSHDSFSSISPFISVVDTPGHTPGSVCLSVKEDRTLFTGDTVFAHGVGRYDFSYSSKNQLQKSLQKIRMYPAETVLYPGHGDSVLLSEIDSDSHNF
ncbi:MAG: MBL fold metallo-hydrolase [Candidatus Roizmanbacteria bacterium]|nr:MBL fold metallo-hydrolase [Candidatus Roizmanbacteria bacterium]